MFSNFQGGFSLDSSKLYRFCACMYFTYYFRVPSYDLSAEQQMNKYDAKQN